MAKKGDEAVLFVLEEPATFDWPVRVPVPVGGKYVQAEFTATFANLVGEEFEALTGSDENGMPSNTDRQVFERVLVGWGADLRGPDGVPLPFTPENKARMQANQRVRLAVVGTYLAAARGMAQEKN